MATSSMLIASLKRLYEDGRITIDKVAELVVNGKITKANYKTITGKTYKASE